ncbi:MAG: hypothetical protein H0T46_01655 [Deltaproteobacteria bacterium]|nr:hypothetical protein [Deltaproteobacteria bacterium]
MKRALAIVVALTVNAAASPVPMVTPPKDWKQDPEQAAIIASKISALKHFGGAKVVVATEAYMSPVPGVALFVTRITADKLVSTREQAVRFAIDDLKARGAAKAYDWRVLPASADHAIIARGEWVEGTTQTVGLLLVAASANQLVGVRGECFSIDKADGAHVNACVQALSTLDPGIPVAERIGFEPAPEGTAPVAAPPVLQNEPARLTDGQNVQLPPMTIPQTKPAADRRPVYLGAGIVLLAALFWWNRRRRERFEREDGVEPASAESAGTDDDADDLAAAARGENPKDQA